MVTTVEQKCWCGKLFTAKVADVKRGWAKCCCKAHAAHAREKKLNRFDYRTYSNLVEKPNFNRGVTGDDYGAAGYEGMEVGWDGHKGLI